MIPENIPRMIRIPEVGRNLVILAMNLDSLRNRAVKKTMMMTAVRSVNIDG